MKLFNIVVLLFLAILCGTSAIEAASISTRTLFDDDGSTVTLKNSRDLNIDGQLTVEDNLVLQNALVTDNIYSITEDGVLAVEGDLTTSESLTVEGVIWGKNDIQYAYLTLSGNQTTPSASDAAAFDTMVYGNMALDAGNYEVTLKAGYVYQMQADINMTFSAAGYCRWQIYDETNYVFIGTHGTWQTVNRNVTAASAPIVFCTIKPSTDIIVEVRFVVEDLASDVIGGAYSSWTIIGYKAKD